VSDAFSHNLFLWPVLLCWIVAVVITLERTFFLWVRAGIAVEPFLSSVQAAISANQIDRALHLCLAEPQAPVAQVVKAALQYADADREDLELAVDAATLDAAPLLHRRVGYLAMIANVVTLFGLLGTIVGLIQSFAAVADADPEQKQTLLAEGISLAMYATAAGISAAIPTLVSYAALVAKSNHILDDVERVGARVVMLLVARKKDPNRAEPA
jgi:biopolymer transport protein ExbB